MCLCLSDVCAHAHTHTASPEIYSWIIFQFNSCPGNILKMTSDLRSENSRNCDILSPVLCSGLYCQLQCFSFRGIPFTVVNLLLNCSYTLLTKKLSYAFSFTRGLLAKSTVVWPILQCEGSGFFLARKGSWGKVQQIVPCQHFIFCTISNLETNEVPMVAQWARQYCGELHVNWFPWQLPTSCLDSTASPLKLRWV